MSLRPATSTLRLPQSYHPPQHAGDTGATLFRISLATRTFRTFSEQLLLLGNIGRVKTCVPSSTGYRTEYK